MVIKHKGGDSAKHGDERVRNANRRGKQLRLTKHVVNTNKCEREGRRDRIDRKAYCNSPGLQPRFENENGKGEREG